MDIIKKLFGSTKQKGFAYSPGTQWTFIGGIWSPVEQNDSLYIDKAYKTIPIIQGMVSEIIDKASDAPPQIMRIKNEKAASQYFQASKNITSPNGKMMMKALRTKAFEQLYDHPILEVFENPNPTMTGKELRESSMGYLLILGNAIEYNLSPDSGLRKGIPREIWSIPTPCVRPVFSENFRDPLKGYVISYMGEKAIEKAKITHIKYFNPVSSSTAIQDTYWGLSPLRSAHKIISQKLDADVAQGTLFKNMSPAGLIVGNSQEGYGELDETEALNINSHFRKSHMGVYNAGDILVTPANVRWEEIGLSPVDLQLIEWNKDIERQIARLYKYPDEMLESGGVVANSEVGVLKFIRNAVYPVISRFDKVRTKKLQEWYPDERLVYLSDLDYYPELQPDKKELVAWMRNAGVFTQKEIRTALDYEENYDENDTLVPVNFMPLSQMRQRNETQV
jgi:HK97 family phage portal protein